MASRVTMEHRVNQESLMRDGFPMLAKCKPSLFGWLVSFFPSRFQSCERLRERRVA